jgi:DNA helicase-2/ATP-dependent DNA helicase PcrA
MNTVNERTNYEIAKEEADKIDAEIIDALKSGKSFRVEAGAGSGKTYSLNRTISWIDANRQSEYRKKKQSVICVTYTNTAVNVINERLSLNSPVLPSTIHSFAWNAIKQFQGPIIRMVTEDEELHPREGDISTAKTVQYTLGYRYIEKGILYLHHNDVITLFARLLDNGKFRRIFANRFPVILIDEYQDSFKQIIDKFIEYYIAESVGPQFGFFGDAWQTIYQSQNACGLIEHEKIIEIKKSSNFRSAPRIVEMLNFLRPELPQISAIDDFIGDVSVITCDDYTGERRTDRNFKGDLPAEEIKDRLSNLTNYIKSKQIANNEDIKTLMITHRVLAAQQEYDGLFEILKDHLRDADDVFLLFFMDIIEPIYGALSANNMQLLFDALKLKRYPIVSKTEKAKWNILKRSLGEARSKRAIDVLDISVKSGLIPISQQVLDYYDLYYNNPDAVYGDTTIQSFLNLNYSQFRAAINFLHPETEFSTEHGVKGEEYDNVIFVISKGWNQYQFEKYAPMIKKGYSKDQEQSYIRNRNLFYVCCSRPKKRLFFFVTVPIDVDFRDFLTQLAGAQNIYTYDKYINQ